MFIVRRVGTPLRMHEVGGVESARTFKTYLDYFYGHALSIVPSLLIQGIPIRRMKTH